MRLKSLVLALVLVLPAGCSDDGPTPGDDAVGDGNGDPSETGDVHITVSDVEAQVRESVLPSEDVELRIVLGSFLHDGC